MSKGKKSKQPKIENSQFDALINQLMSVSPITSIDLSFIGICSYEHRLKS